MANSFENELETPDVGSLSSLAENIVYRLPGCSDIMVRKTIQDVYRDFCRRSCCLCGRRQFTVTSEDTGIRVRPYYGGVVDAIVEVTCDGRKLYRNDYSENNETVVLADRFIPDDDCPEDNLPTVVVTFVEVPKIGGENVPSWFIQRHGESVCSGVLSRLFSMTGRPWSDPSQAAMENVRYENAVNEHRMRYYAEHSNCDCGTMVCSDELV